MRKKSGFSVIGAVVAIVVLAAIAIASYLLIRAEENVIDWKQYDFYSVVETNEDNGMIGEHIKGSADAPVLIIEYADYECPYCATVNKKINKLIEEYDGQFAVAFRMMILSSIHPNSNAASSAVEAAGLQGYWKEYGDYIFEKQSEWSYATSSTRNDYFKKYFQEVTKGAGDTEKFLSDLNSENVKKKVTFDNTSAKIIGVGGTPAFYIDGKFIDWSNTSGGSVEVGGKVITWTYDSVTAEGGFESLMRNIINAKLASLK